MCRPLNQIKLYIGDVLNRDDRLIVKNNLLVEPLSQAPMHVNASFAGFNAGCNVTLFGV